MRDLRHRSGHAADGGRQRRSPRTLLGVRRLGARDRGRASTSRPRCSPSIATPPVRRSAPTAPGAFMLACTGDSPTRSSSTDWSVARRGSIGDQLDLVSRRPGVHRRRGRHLADRHGHHVGAGRSRSPRRQSMGPAASRSCPRSPGSPRRTGNRTPRLRSPDCRWAPNVVTSCAPRSRASPHRWRCSPRPPDATSGAPLTRLRVDGGLTRSSTLLQVQADLLQAPSRSTRRRTPPPSVSPRSPISAPVRRHGPSSPRQRGAEMRSWSRESAADEAAERLAAWQARRGGDDGPDERRRHGLDVVVVGAGVVGCAVARLLSHRHGCASRSSRPGPTSVPAPARPTRRSCTPASTPHRVRWRRVSWRAATTLLRAYAPTVGHHRSKRPGRCWWRGTTSRQPRCPNLAAKARANGYNHTEVVDAAAVYDSEPHLGAGVTGGMIVPDEHIIDPWSTPLAFAYEAVANGWCSRSSSNRRRP